MKNLIVLFSLLIVFSITATAQVVPQLMNYQAVARDSTGALLLNRPVGLQITIHDSSATGTVVYQETDTVTTNQYGLFTVSVGGGTAVSGYFPTIEWGTGSKYLQVAIDPAGGTNYVSVGTSQLVSVPYAFHARTAALDWDLEGNSGNGSGYFLGTLDTQPLVIKLNNIQNGKLDVHGNIALGQNALNSNISGNDIVAVGKYALYYDTVSNIVAVGDSALYNLVSGGANVAVGYQALYSNISGSSNTAMGNQSLQNDSNSSNTAFGASALESITSGQNNTAIGSIAYPYTGSLNNYTGLGYDVGYVSSVSNSVEIGNTSVTRIVGEVAQTTYSDGRIKDNIQENVPGLAFINKLRPVTYNLNIHRQNEMMYAGKKGQVDFPGKYDIEKTLMTGFVAQEVEQAAQAAGYDFSGVDKPADATGLYGLRYSEFVVPLVKGMQELSKHVDDLNKQVEDLKKQLEQATSDKK